MAVGKKKFLVINLTRMGDILQSTPLLRAFKSRDPEVEISYLAVARFADVCRSIPEIDRLIPFDFGSAVAISKEAVRCLPRRLKEMQAFIDLLRGEDFDAVINISHSRISALICHLLGVANTRGLTVSREGYRLIPHPWARYFFTANLNRHYNRFNLVDINQGLALDTGEFAADSSPASPLFGRHGLSFQIKPEAQSKADKLLTGWAWKEAPFLIGFQPGASLPSKTWPADSFSRLGRLLRDELGAGILVFGTDKEVKLADEVSKPLGDAALNVAGKTDIGALGALLSRLDLLVTNDTGTQHIAAALGTPVLSLCFGSALAHETGPYGKGHLVVEAALPCYPCSFHVECHRFRCQEHVRPEIVYHVAKMMLAEGHQRDTGREDETWSQNINIWRTDFDPDGFWMLRPLIRRPITASDYINACAREIWKEILTSPDETVNSKTDLDFKALQPYLVDYHPPDMEAFLPELEEPTLALRRLASLARSGRKHCRALEEACAPSDIDLEAVKSAGEEIARIDREITLTGFRLPPVNHLVLDFNFRKQNFETNDIRQLAQQTKQLYQRLENIASKFNRALNAWGSMFRAVGWYEAPMADAVPYMSLSKPEDKPGSRSGKVLEERCEAI